MNYIDHDKDIAYETAIKIAEKMLKNNEPLDKIISYTGLTEDEINKIKADNKL